MHWSKKWRSVLDFWTAECYNPEEAKHCALHFPHLVGSSAKDYHLEFHQVMGIHHPNATAINWVSGGLALNICSSVALYGPVHKLQRMQIPSVYNWFFFIHALNNSHILCNAHMAECMIDPVLHSSMHWPLVSFVKHFYIASPTQSGSPKRYTQIF